MAAKLKNELLDVDLSAVIIKIQARHPKSAELIETISEMLRNIGIPFKFSDIADSCLYTFSQLYNEDIYIALFMWYLWAFLVDDHFERNPQDFSKWFDILSGEECLADGPIEKLYELFLKAANKAFTKKSLDEALRLTKDWLDSAETLQQFSSDEVSDENFMETRMQDAGAPLCFYFVQIDAALEVTKELASDENWNKLRFNVMVHLAIINDLFSLKKEVMAGQEKTNYVCIKMKNHNISAQQAVEQLLIEAENAENMAHYHGRKLKESYDIEGLNTYVDGLLNTMAGNIYWSSICKRYNDIYVTISLRCNRFLKDL